ncbi:hypothetical protein C9J85_18835 [Haloferax sp. wsp5]|nr:hypothetical protein C9J85_18835 [Haloferax sp. wsp5]
MTSNHSSRRRSDRLRTDDDGVQVALPTVGSGIYNGPSQVLSATIQIRTVMACGRDRGTPAWN